VAIFGEGFSAGSDIGLPEVRFGDKRGDAVLMLDDGQINVTVPPHGAGLVDVTVTLPDGQSESLRDAYLYKGSSWPSSWPSSRTRPTATAICWTAR
jgi:hypothetical protein